MKEEKKNTENTLWKRRRKAAFSRRAKLPTRYGVLPPQKDDEGDRIGEMSGDLRALKLSFCDPLQGGENSPTSWIAEKLNVCDGGLK